MSLATALALSLAWWCAFAVGRAVGHVHAALAPVAVVALALAVARAPRRGMGWWAGAGDDVDGHVDGHVDGRVARRAVVRVVGFDALVGLAFGVVSVVATHAAYGPLARALPSLPSELGALYALAAVSSTTLLATVAIALAEEALWRGALEAALASRVESPAVRVAVTSVVYGLAQSGAGSPWLVVAAVGLGACWGALARWRGGRLVAPAVAHLVWTLAILGAWPLPR